MSNEQLDYELGKFWGSYINSFTVDFCTLELLLGLDIHQNNSTTRHTIVFQHVSAFFFVNGKGEKRLETGQWASAELSEIYYNKHPIDHVFHKHDKTGTPQYSADFNFYLEIWSTVLLIEAKTVIIDGVVYDISLV